MIRNTIANIANTCTATSLMSSCLRRKVPYRREPLGSFWGIAAWRPTPRNLAEMHPGTEQATSNYFPVFRALVRTLQARNLTCQAWFLVGTFKWVAEMLPLWYGRRVPFCVGSGMRAAQKAQRILVTGAHQQALLRNRNPGLRGPQERGLGVQSVRPKTWMPDGLQNTIQRMVFFTVRTMAP